MVTTDTISQNKRRRRCKQFNATTLPLLPAFERNLLKEWLKNDAPVRSWTALLAIAGQGRIEVAESLLESLLANGAVQIEERFKNAHWQPAKLIWHDYEALCAAIGLATSVTKRHAFTVAWEAAQRTIWQDHALEVAHRSLRETRPDWGQSRLALLLKLNEWLHHALSGTRRDFSLFARGKTKQISHAEWAWLSKQFNLSAYGIEQHTPALWIAGQIQFDLDGRAFDIGATGDFLGLTARTFERLISGSTGARHYRLIENRTSFENVARKACSGNDEIVIWLPGYAPDWWRTCIKRLLKAVPLPAQISCDADPDGVQIALNAGILWREEGLSWTAEAMDVECLAAARNKVPITEHDAKLAQSLLNQPELLPDLADLLRFILEHQVKAEQENWL